MLKRLMMISCAMIVAGCSSEPDVPQGDQLTAGEGLGQTTFAMPPATSEGYFDLKPGLWIRTASASGQELGEDRICIDASVLSLMQPERDIERVLGDDCDSVEQTPGPEGVTFSTICRRLGKTEVKGLMSGSSEVLRTQIAARTPDGSLGSEYFIESKWSGECPQGMAVGETE